MSKNYRLSNDVRYSYADAEGNVVDVVLKAGDVNPATPEEEVAVANLALAGLLEEVVAKSTRNSKSDVTADAPSEE